LVSVAWSYVFCSTKWLHSFGGSVIKSSIINCWSIVHLLVHFTNS
jgi:hypothetical protein